MGLERLFSVVGGCCLWCVVGSMYIFGSIAPYLLIYYNSQESNKSTTTTITMSDLLLVFPIRGLLLLVSLSGGEYCYSKQFSIRK